jgi:cytochrome c-type biogenesis protein CcsB
MKRNPSLLFLLPLLFALSALPVTADSGAISFEDAWRSSGFDHLAIQKMGIVKTATSFARDSLRNVTTHHLQSELKTNEGNLTLLLRLMANPAAHADSFLIPIEGDDLIAPLEAQGLTVRDRALRLRDCVIIDPASGQIVRGGTALMVAADIAQRTEENSPVHEAASRLAGRIVALMTLRDEFRFIPDPIDLHGQWANLAEAESLDLPDTDAIAAGMRGVMRAVAEDDPVAAESAATAVAGALRAWPNAPSDTRLAIDYQYTTRRPYFWASFAYIASAGLFLVSLISNSKRWWVAAVAVMGGGWIVHMLGAAARGHLIHRVPLSSLYEATTTGLAFVIFFALLFELIYRMKIVGLTSALLAFIYYRWLLSSDTFGNDAIEPLRAVLNSYWLDYHVTCMILSYGAFTVAFGMAVLHLVKCHLPRLMGWAPPAEQLDLYSHRAIQVGWPLLGIGVVLGAVWADTAWGRMWSWDPKETWALITWLVYTAYLHVRLVSGWRGAIMSWASIAGYGCVMFTYLGVNFVLSGLHSYAGNDPIVLTGPVNMFKELWFIVVPFLLVMAGVVFWAIMRIRAQSGIEPAEVALEE